ncbi:MarR family transcriptional regulator, 2-MHQ and catechol-resistance regulon repressor [Paenibacillus algorifonticola]|uniref:MarR family transcriptional regulator, 2-MHQ and catechol-resistance regulon repressor n=1 Tax=Paenibacillus algorifonticola TaxID=684063 RepID=A0A1I2J1Y2_9BACL|nr:MarR family transcriptional regulator [Paenibacillus algorifonticola]SFF47873.1 MarR family transcriptional regulator, 2-MHQ and catechol-resistance regulon repressor [Paenibacillus algorifonticola]
MYQADERTELDLRLFRVWSKASMAVFGNVKKDIASHGIEPEQFIILELLYSKGPQPITKISETFSIPTGSITYVVDKLEKKGYVKRHPSPTDRRASNAALTESGTQLFNEIFPKHAEMISRSMSFIDDSEKELLIQLLKKIGLGAEQLS